MSRAVPQGLIIQFTGIAVILYLWPGSNRASLLSKPGWN